MTLKEAVKRSMSEKYDFPDIFNDDCGLNIAIPERKLHAVKSWGYTKNTQARRVILEIRTFVGISFGAIHYYGKLNVQGVNMEYDEHPGRSTMLDDKNLPLGHYTYNLELKRPLTQKEIDEDPKRWGDYYDVGDLTNCFETIEEIIELTKEIFKLRFKGDWELHCDSPYKCFNGKIEIQ